MPRGSVGPSGGRFTGRPCHGSAGPAWRRSPPVPRMAARNRGCLQNILVWPDVCSLCCLALSRACLRCCRCCSAHVSQRVWSGMGGAPHATQSPRDLASWRLAWAWRRFCSLRSGLWALFSSYSRLFCSLASRSAGVGSTRGLGFLAWGAAFLVGLLALGFPGGFRTGGFLAFRGSVLFRVWNSKEYTKSCGLRGSTPAAAGSSTVVAQPFAEGRGGVSPRLRGR